MIQFKSTFGEARILSPLKNFEQVTQPIEHREDPLTHRSVIVIKGRMDYVKRFIESDAMSLQELIQSTLSDCPFCPGSVVAKAPKFIHEIAPGGRIQVGEAVCFPSLFAHSDHNAVVVPSPSHGLGLNDFTSDVLANGFKACLEYFERVRAHSPDSKYPAIVINVLPPAGSTIAHMHLQALVGSTPLHETRELIEASRAYYERQRTCYWVDLAGIEKQLGVRYLAEAGDVCWLTPYAPMGLNEVQAIVGGKSSLNALTDEDVRHLADGIVNTARFYYDIGVRSFNAAVYSGASQESNDYFRVGFRMVSRYGYKPRFVSDVWALQYLLGEREIYESPEETCIKLRKYFQ